MSERKKILVVDDNSVTTNLVRFNLESAGYYVAEAYNGHEAWQIADEETFDLVITDEKMPKMTGLDLLRLLRSDARYEQTPVIFLTGTKIEFDDRCSVNGLAVTAIIGKPFSSRDLISTVQAALSDTGAAVEFLPGS
jgi:two-component system alkaline phosphatase synthesis response regulator PhoP